MSLWIAGTNEGFEAGTTYLHHAADLWSLMDEQRGKRIGSWLDDWWAPHETDPEINVYNVVSLRYLLGLLDGIGDALRAEITDEHWRLDPETAARIKSSKEWLVDSWDEPGGPILTLENRVSEVHQLESLVQKAIKMNRALEVRMWAGT